MHSYLRAIGFSHLEDRKIREELLQEVSTSCDVRNAVRMHNGHAFVEYVKEFAPGCGIVVCGEMDESGFHRDYYFPYFETENISSRADLVIEKHGGKNSFAGVCEDGRIGSSLIFYVLNAAEYQKKSPVNQLTGGNVSVSFSGLSTEGKILLPVQKSPNQIQIDREAARNRNHMITAARNGDQDAIESLTMEDMDNYSMISRRIMREDVFSIVDTFFMPFGMECDYYQIMGEILSIKQVRNYRTKEKMYQMRLLCNDLEIDICMNEEDLMGDPDVGRRFKGNLWLQGFINYPE